MSGNPELPPRVGRVAAASTIAYSLAAISAEQWMRDMADPDEVAMLVMENDEQSKALIKRTHRTLSDPKLRQMIERDLGADYVLSRIIYPVHFEEKTDSSALQIADVCAFVLKRYLMRTPEHERFYRLLAPNLVNDLSMEGEKVVLAVGTKPL